MTKVNPNSGNETKSDIFPRDIFKSDITFIGRKILKCLLSLALFSIIAKVSTNN